MSHRTAIEWADATWNPILGCSIGCANCYAVRQARRIALMARARGIDGDASPYFGLTKVVNGKPVWSGRVARASESVLTNPLRWRRPRRIFVNSDLFHEDIPDEWIDEVFAVMALAHRHTFIVLTIRSKRMRAYVSGWFERLGTRDVWVDHPAAGRAKFASLVDWSCLPAVLPNVWLMVSAGRQSEADERIPDLLATPAAIRGVSAEPPLGPIDFTRVARNGLGLRGDALRWPGMSGPSRSFGNRLDWIVTGGEYGPGARPCPVPDIRSIVNQCASAGVACFVKQLGPKPIMNRHDAVQAVALGAGWDSRAGDDRGIVTLRHRKGADISEWPSDLRVRQYPAARTRSLALAGEGPAPRAPEERTA
jgi:protein gp37